VRLACLYLKKHIYSAVLSAKWESVPGRVPGMLYILASFAPWIAYWVLCGLGLEIGVALALVLSTLLALPQLRRGELNPMDAASLVYFGLAAVATYLLGSKLFIEKSGLLGYLALFLMAFASLAVGKPYTLQVSRRDYPPVYWSDPSFLLINRLLTAVWAAVFLASASAHALFDVPLSLLLSNALIAVGVALSIALPVKLPAYLATREFKRYDWSVRVEPGASKREDEYDVIVVGSGIGGLTCGALLAKWGYRVLVLEQHYQAGGYCSSFRRGGFTFNTGVENVSGLWARGPVSYLLRELGLSKDDLFVRNRVRFIYKGREIEASSLEEFTAALVSMFPDEEGSIRAFFEEARRAYEECYSDLTYGVPLPAELIAKVQGPRKLLDYPREHPHFYDWMNKTYRQKLDEFFRSEDLKTLLCALLGYLGTRPEETPASSALTAVVSYYLHGGYFPKGGAQRFADALKDYIESRGGKVLLMHRVDKILVENGEVRGVLARGKVYRSRVVVANANAKTALLELVGEEHLPKEYAEHLKSLRMSPSAFMVFLGVDMDLSGYPSIIENLDEGYSLVINSNADPGMAPAGKSSVTILTLADSREFPERGTREYQEKKHRLAWELVRKAEKAVPGLGGHVVVMDAATPRTFERYTSMPEGAIYAFDQSVGTKRPYFKTPIKGLYLASASTFPGGGIEAVVISGVICAHDIAGWSARSKP